MADRARTRYLTLLDNSNRDTTQLRVAARAVTLVNVIDIAMLLIVVWAMYARPGT